MADRHSGTLMTAGGIMVTAGGIFMAVAAFEPSKTPGSVWSNAWFDVGFGFVILGLLIAAAGFYVHFRRDSAAAPQHKERPEEHRSELGVGERLSAGQSLHSPNGRLRLDMQQDGNLVIRLVGGKSTWDSKTAGTDTAAYLAMQGDGNLVLYAGDGRVLWETETAGTGANRLVMRNNGNLFLYADHGVVWHAGVSVPGLD